MHLLLRNRLVIFNGFDHMTSNEEKIDGPPDEKKPFFSASSEDVTVSCDSSREMAKRLLRLSRPLN
jgi:hypothetical protein